MTILVPVIMSGGAGTRLWPVSREGHPKPFMKLADGETLIEKTYRRAAKLPGVIQADGKSKLITVTNRDYYFMSRDELDKAGARGSFLLEPCGRNTAPAIAMAAHRVQDKFGPDALMLVLSADHLIRDELAFAEAVEKAVQLGASDAKFLVTFGIMPTKPETGFGYIKIGGKLEGGCQVEAFVEKPDVSSAQKYLDSGAYLWNSGMFCFAAGKFLEQLKLYAQDVYEVSSKCWSLVKPKSANEDILLEIPEDLFRQMPDISIDHAVLEKSNCVAVVQCDMGWSDIGSWGAISNQIEPDVNCNRVVGEAILLGSSNTFVHAESRLVATVGVNDMIIVETADAVLVANADRVQDVKKIVAQLKSENHVLCSTHKTVVRPWGTYTIIEEGMGFKIKRIEVKPNASLSLQMHQHRSEHWVVVSGIAKIVNGDEEVIIQSNESAFIPQGQKHRVENPGNTPCVMIEIQCGNYLGEDDIVRFDDIYGRGKIL